MATYRLDGQDMEALVREGLGNPSTGEVSAARLVQLINLAQLELVKGKPGSFPMLHKSEDITTVASTAEYTLTETDVVAIRFLSSTAVPRLEKYSREDVERMGSQTSVDPYGWYEASGGNDGDWAVGLVGTPSAAGKTITAHLVICPPEIVYDPDVASTTSTSSLPQAWDYPIVSKAVELGLELGGRREDAKKQAALTAMAELRARRAVGSRSEKHWPIGGALPRLRVR